MGKLALYSYVVFVCVSGYMLISGVIKACHAVASLF
jgi:hypothetical protein